MEARISPSGPKLNVDSLPLPPLRLVQKWVMERQTVPFATPSHDGAWGAPWPCCASSLFANPPDHANGGPNNNPQTGALCLDRAALSMTWATPAQGRGRGCRDHSLARATEGNGAVGGRYRHLHSPDFAALRSVTVCSFYKYGPNAKCHHETTLRAACSCGPSSKPPGTRCCQASFCS